MAVSFGQDDNRPGALNDRELSTVSAICNRVSRMLGLMDREGLQQDIAIVQSHCPLNLDALLSAKDQVFVDELLSIVDAADRGTGSLKNGFRSRFMLDEMSDQLFG